MRCARFSRKSWPSHMQFTVGLFACRGFAAYLPQISERAHGGWVHGLGKVLLHEAQQLLLQLLHLPGMPRLSALSRAESGSENC